MVVEATALSVHRCRFVDYTPSAVTALAFPPLPLPSVKGKKRAASKKPLRFGTLAVGRGNGNIELCEWTGSEQNLQAPQAWVVSKTIPGPYSSKVDSLAFALRDPDAPSDETPSLSDLRLFSAGGGSELAEWDIERGCIRRTLPSQGGSIWCITPNPASTLLAIGCEDGAVRLLSLEHDTLTHLRRLDRVKSRILSIAWGPPVPKESAPKGERAGGESDDSDDDEDEDEDEWKDSWVVAGCSDSSVRKWDAASGRVTDRMGTDKMRGERTLVWAVQTLGDGTIVSGDSLGMVKFWDSKTCTQLHSFQAHGADVLCLTVSPEGTAVYSSGVDQKVVQFTYVKTTQPTTSLLSRTSHRWVQSVSRRLHSHDVRALAIWPPHTPLPPTHHRQFPLDVAPVLASGGLDMSVVVTPAALPSSTITKVINPLSTSTVATFEDSYHRRLAYSSGGWQGSAVHVARQARLVLCQRDAGVSIWRILEKNGRRRGEDQKGEDGEDEEGPLPSLGGWKPVLDMDLSVHTNIVASAISDDGRWIVVADWYETKLFKLLKSDNGEIKPKRIRDFTSILRSHLPESVESTGASAFAFTPDGTKLVLGTAMSGYLLVIDLSGDKPQVLRRFEQHRSRDVVLGQRVIRGRSKSVQVEDVEMADEDGEKEKDGMVVDDETSAPTSPKPSNTSSSESDSDDEEETTPLPQKPLTPTITRLAISPDGQYLASVSISSPPSSPPLSSTPSLPHQLSRTHIYNLDSITHTHTLPSFPPHTPIHALAFTSTPTSPHAYTSLVLGLANNSIHVYDVEARTFPLWARETTGEEGVPLRVRGLHDPILGVAFDYERGGALKPVFWGATWLCRVHLDAGRVESRRDGGDFEKKRRRWGGKSLASRPVPKGLTSGMNAIALGERGAGGDVPVGSQENFKLVTTYRPILFVDFVGEKEVVVVERPLVDVLARLPPAFFKPKYGAT